MTAQHRNSALLEVDGLAASYGSFLALSDVTLSLRTGEIVALLGSNGAGKSTLIRQRLADAWIGLEIMRYNALRILSTAEGVELPPAALITKLYWATWHRRLGKLAMDVLGPEAEIAAAGPYEPTPLQRLFLFSRSDTIYAGSNEIQRNLIAERALGLPREPRPA